MFRFEIGFRLMLNTCKSKFFLETIWDSVSNMVQNKIVWKWNRTIMRTDKMTLLRYCIPFISFITAQFLFSFLGSENRMIKLVLFILGFIFLFHYFHRRYGSRIMLIFFTSLFCYSIRIYVVSDRFSTKSASVQAYKSFLIRWWTCTSVRLRNRLAQCALQ